MIKKEREFPLQIKLGEALLRRLHPEHEKRPKILSQLRNIKAGFRGEEELDYQLTFLPKENYLIFNNLHLPAVNNGFFQIDTLVLTPQAIFIIESKNIYGHLFFDSTTNQVIRTFDGRKDGFPNPILQAKRQKKNLHKWLAQFMTKEIPTHTFVSIGYPNTILETQPGNENIFEQVLHAEYIPDRIMDYIEKQPEPRLTSYQIRRISDLLLQQHTLKESTFFPTRKISSTDLVKGIACPQCKSLPMKRTHSKWICSQCSHSSRSAHTQVIEDYLLIFGSITNRECRQLLKLENKDVVKRLLLSMDLPFSGQDKNRRYYARNINLSQDKADHPSLLSKSPNSAVRDSQNLV